MKRSVLASLVLVGMTACGSADAPEQVASTPATPSSSSPTVTPVAEPTLTRDGCPVPDEEFCDTATRIGRALQERDAAALLRLSRADTIECEQVAREYFPGCADADILTGYGLSGANFVVEVVPKAAYAQRLVEVVSGIDPGLPTTWVEAPRASSAWARAVPTSLGDARTTSHGPRPSMTGPAPSGTWAASRSASTGSSGG